MKKIIIFTAVIIISLTLIFGILYLTLPKKESIQKIKPTGQTKEFNLELFNWGFEPKIITVQAGDLVKFNVITRDIDHGIGINEFMVNKRVQPGQVTKVEFLADKRGQFRMYCTVPCGEGHLTMEGKLIVK